jgi:hypothetical protein
MPWSTPCADDEQTDRVVALSRADITEVVPAETVPLPFDLEEEVRALVNQDKVISAIYLYRTTIHCSLREAHDYVLALKPR